MEDQVQQLRDEGINAAMLNSALDQAEQREVLRGLHDGFRGLLYVAPERFFAPSFQPVIEKLRPKLFRELKPGTRVVSHVFNMGPEWPPEETRMVGPSRIFLWTIQ